MIKIYFADITDKIESEYDKIGFNKERLKYISEIKDSLRRLQSVAVWDLLIKALKKDFGCNNPEFIFDGKKWSLINSTVKFSLSHSNNLVAVAISDEGNIGVDVEKIDDKILKAKNLLGEETSLKCLTKLWTEKEAEFKCGKKENKKIYSTEISDKKNNEYILSVATDKINEIPLFIKI